ncbi:MAG: hypothetical protein QHH18_05210 [Candidatus Bathyarchaeota archaeon]|nr:hypothetical protein [Candidatus Bathyarchaeota archaeon A05DMB-5]MDH7557988.1 hypothetical protein [Candidatus Bathyarchaeota archaeon]
MKEKLLLSALMATLIALSFASSVKAAASIEIYGYVDKPQYKPGEQGNLRIWIYNDGTEDITIKSITVEYPWHDAYVWEGNETIKDIQYPTIDAGENRSFTLTFTVPTDGRAIASGISNIKVRTVTDKITETKNIPISIASTPAPMSIQDMDKLITLFTILTVLIIVCTIIIASTIFLSTRKPQVTWKTTEE